MAIPWPSIISAGGQILGSVLGKSTTMGPSKTIQKTVHGAKKAGIHPLAALGAAPGYQTVPGNPLGAGIAAGAEALADGLQKNSDPLKKSAVDLNNAQAELVRQQTNTVIKELGENVRGGTTGARNVSNPKKSPDIQSDLLPSSEHFKTGTDKKLDKLPDFLKFGTKGNRMPHPDKATDPEGWLMGEALDGNAEPAARKLAKDNGVSWKRVIELMGESGYEIGKAIADLKGEQAVRSANALWRAIRYLKGK